MNKQPLGITVGTGGAGVYQDENGIDTFESDAPYLLSDSKSLVAPLPVHVVDGPVFIDSMGNVQKAIPVRGVTPPDDPGGITWDNSTTWDGGTYWS